MTAVALGITAAAVASAVGSAVAADQAAEGAENAQATLQGGISRMTAFRGELKKQYAEYGDWQKSLTGQLVTDAMQPDLESQAYKDAQRRLTAAQAGVGSVRSGAAEIGRAQLAGAESDAQIQRRLQVDQLVSQQVARGEALRAHTYDAEASLLGGKANAQMEEANARAAGTEAIAGGVSSALSGAAGAYAGYGGGAGLTAPTGGGYAATGGGGLAGTGVQQGAIGAGSIGGGQTYDAALLGGMSPAQIDEWRRLQGGY